MVTENGRAEEEIRDAFERRDAEAVRRFLEQNPELRARINEPVFGFNSPAIVAFANDAAMVDVLLEFGADPNRRSEWWAGGFHALYSATGAAADRLIVAGAVADACAAAQLDRPELLARMLSEDPSRAHERGGDGQTRSILRSRALWSICSCPRELILTPATSIIVQRRRNGCSIGGAGADASSWPGISWSVVRRRTSFSRRRSA
jgi:hypothetical protein